MSQGAAVDLKVLISVVQDSQNNIAAALTNLQQLLLSIKGIDGATLANATSQLTGIKQAVMGTANLAEDASKKIGEIGHNTNLPKFKKDVDESTHSLASLDEMIGRAGEGMRFLAGGFLALESVRFIKDLADTAARTEVLGTVLHIVGVNAGYTTERIDEIDKSVQRMGITASASRTALTQMLQAGLNVESATGEHGLARAAQDLAVISGENSSVTFQRMVGAIQRLSTEELRYMGILINTEQAEALYAGTIGKTSSQLTMQEKQQGLLNAVLEQAARLTGTYEAAMGNVGKQLTSLERYQEELKVSLGNSLLPAYLALVEQLTLLLKHLQLVGDEEGAQSQAAQHFGNVIKDIAEHVREFIEFLAKHRAAIVTVVESYAIWKLAIQPVGALITFISTTALPMLGNALGLAARMYGVKTAATIADTTATIAHKNAVLADAAAQRELFSAEELAAGKLATTAAENTLAQGELFSAEEIAATGLATTTTAAETAATAAGALVLGWGLLVGALATAAIGTIYYIYKEKHEDPKTHFNSTQASRNTLYGSDYTNEAVPGAIPVLTEEKRQEEASKQRRADEERKKQDSSKTNQSRGPMGYGAAAPEIVTTAIDPELASKLAVAEENYANAMTKTQTAQTALENATNPKVGLPNGLMPTQEQIEKLRKDYDEAHKKERDLGVEFDKLTESGHMDESRREAELKKVTEKKVENERRLAGLNLQTAEQQAGFPGKYEVQNGGIVGHGFEELRTAFNLEVSDKTPTDMAKDSLPKVKQMIKEMAAQAKTREELTELKTVVETFTKSSRLSPNKQEQSEALAQLHNAGVAVRDALQSENAKVLAEEHRIITNREDMKVQDAQKALDHQKNLNKAAEDLDTAHYANGLLDVNTYYANRTARINSEASKELTLLEAQRHKLVEERDKATLPQNRGALDVQIAQIGNQETKLSEDTENKRNENALAQQKEEKSLRLQLLDLEIQADKYYEGDLANIEAINKKYQVTADKLRIVKGSQADLNMERAKAVDLIKAEDESTKKTLQDQVALEEARISVREAQVASQMTHGNITASQDQDYKNQLTQQRMTSIQSQIAASESLLQEKTHERALEEERVRGLQENSGKTQEALDKIVTDSLRGIDLQMVEIITHSTELQAQLLKLGDQIVTYGQRIQKSFTSGFEKALTDLMSHTKQAQFAFRDMAIGWGKELAGGLSEYMSKGLTNIVKRATSKQDVDIFGNPRIDENGKPIMKPGTDIFTRMGDLLKFGKDKADKVLGSKEKPMWIKNADKTEGHPAMSTGAAAGNAAYDAEGIHYGATNPWGTPMYKGYEKPVGVSEAASNTTATLHEAGVHTPPALAQGLDAVKPIFDLFHKKEKLAPALRQHTPDMEESSISIPDSANISDLVDQAAGTPTLMMADGGVAGGDTSSEVPAWLANLLAGANQGAKADNSGSEHMSSGDVGGDFKGIRGGVQPGIFQGVASFLGKFMHALGSVFSPGAMFKEAQGFATDSRIATAEQDNTAIGFAGGGLSGKSGQIHGAGTTKSDSIPAMLSNKEFIMPADKTERYYPLLEAIRQGKNIGHYMGGLIQSFAEGGLIGDYSGFAFARPAFAEGGLIGGIDSVPVQSIAIPGVGDSRMPQSNLAQQAAEVKTGNDGVMQLMLHPETMNMSMRDWLEHETVRQYGRR